jgi:hypothetical protein
MLGLRGTQLMDESMDDFDFDSIYQRDLVNDWAMTRMADAEMGDL